MKNPAHPPLVLCELSETGIDGVETFSPFCLEVRRALAASGLAYTSRRGHDPGVFKNLSAAGQVPLLLVGQEVVADSTAILARISAPAPGALYVGLDAHGRAESRLWEELADTALNGFLLAAQSRRYAFFMSVHFTPRTGGVKVRSASRSSFGVGRTMNSLVCSSATKPSAIM